MARRFGQGAARSKLQLLARIRDFPPPGERLGSKLAESLEFLRAYPDDPAVRRAVEATVAQVPGTDVVYEYSYAVVRRLLPQLRDRMEIDWESLEDDSLLLDAIDLAVLPGDADGLADMRVTLREWFAEVRPHGSSDLEFLVGLLERSGIPEPVRVHLFESAGVPIRYRGPRPSDLGLRPMRACYQRKAVARERFPLPPFIRRPAGRAVRAGAAFIDLALQALCVRRLEIYPLIYGSDRDVVLVNAGRGVRVALIGVEPDWRSPLEVLTFFLILKNGVPVGYGPAAIFDGCCEMGINLFPEFRGGEIRYFYGQLMRVLHHRMGVDYFFLTRYGMGEGNEDAIRSGAFWFYRKLGFRPTSPEVEALACEEERRIRAQPGYRSDRRMLHRLSHTQAYLDLSGGARRPHDFAQLSAAGSRALAASADRGGVASRQARRLGRMLGIDPAGRGLLALAPLLSRIPDLQDWPAGDRESLARFLRAKEGPAESRAARLSRHPRLAAALRKIARQGWRSGSEVRSGS